MDTYPGDLQEMLEEFPEEVEPFDVLIEDGDSPNTLKIIF